MNELEKQTAYYLGDFIIRLSEDGTLKVTSDRGVMKILPQANNAVEIKSEKHK